MQDFFFNNPYLIPTLFAVFAGLFGMRLWRAAQDLRAKGLPVRPEIPADALFGESRVSGHVEATTFSRISGASNSLIVWVTRQEFVVDGIFPFNLFMHSTPDFLRARVPIRTVISAQQADARSVLITFPDSHHEPRTLRLFLKNPGDLISALKSLNVRVNQPA
jgi:hypothetical protein